MRGAYFLIESTDSIVAPPEDPVPAEISDIPDVTTYSVEPST